MLSIKNLKAALNLLGIRDLTIKFHPAEETIEANFNYSGQQHRRLINFKDIEIAFENTPSVDSEPLLRPDG